jgi:hypothetical protein
MKKVVNKELLIFKQYQVDVRILNVFFNKGKSMKTCFFLIVGLIVHQILGILGSKTEIKRTFFLINILTKLRSCRQFK